MNVSSAHSSSLWPGGSSFRHNCSASRAVDSLAFTKEEDAQMELNISKNVCLRIPSLLKSLFRDVFCNHLAGMTERNHAKH